MSSLKATYTDARAKFVYEFARRATILSQHVESDLMLAYLLPKAHDAPKLATLRALVRHCVRQDITDKKCSKGHDNANADATADDLREVYMDEMAY